MKKKILAQIKRTQCKVEKMFSFGRTSGTQTVKYLIEQYCKGKGMEIGPGKSPYCNPGRTTFLDRFIDNCDGARHADIVADASAIPVKNNHFDYLLSAHCLEHCPNTLKTLLEWKRVISPGGIIFLILPHADRTLDRHRAKTTLQHHISDYELLGDEADYSHVDEIMAGWSKNEDFAADKLNYERDWGAPVWDFEFRIRQGVIHYHVWTEKEIIPLLEYIGMQILHVVETVPERQDSFLVIARK